MTGPGSKGVSIEVGPFEPGLAIRYPRRREVASGEGWSLTVADRHDDFVVIEDEGTMAEFTPGDVDPATLIRVRHFASASERDRYVVENFGARVAETEDRRRRSVDSRWRVFERSLVEVLMILEPDQLIWLGDRTRSFGVVLRREGEAMLAAERWPVSGGDQEVDELLGWPSPGLFDDVWRVEARRGGREARQLAGLVVRTLSEKSGAAGLGGIEYDASDGHGAVVLLPTLRISRHRDL